MFIPTCASSYLRPAIIDSTVFSHRYGIGRDPARWVRVDPLTGNITTIRELDRESPHVVIGVYTILVYAVEEGKCCSLRGQTPNINIF